MKVKVISKEELDRIKKGDKLTIKNGRIPYEVVDICTEHCFEVFLPKDETTMRVTASYIEKINFINQPESKSEPMMVKRDDITVNPICPKCDYIFKEDFKFCPKCGLEVVM